MPFLAGGGSARSTGKRPAEDTPSPSQRPPPPENAKPDLTLFVHVPESMAKLTHTFHRGDNTKTVNQTKRVLASMQVGFIHESQIWQNGANVDNPRFNSKYEGLCNKDADGNIMSGPAEFVATLQREMVEQHDACIGNVVYLLKHDASSVPERFTEYTAFQNVLKEVEFPELSSSVLHRLSVIENFLQEQFPS